MKRPTTSRDVSSLSRRFPGWSGWVAMTALICFLAGCGGDEAPITAETSKYQVDEGNAASPASSASPAPATAPASPAATDPSPTDSGTPPSVPVGDAPPAPSSTTPEPSAAPTGTPDSPPGDAPPKPSATPPAAAAKASPANSKVAAALAQMAKLQGQDPRGATQEETLTNLVKVQRQVIDLANQVMGEKATDGELQQAAQFKLQSLLMLSQIQREAQQELDAYMSELKRSPQPTLQRLGDRLEFAQQLERFAGGDKEDGGKFLARFQKLFEEEPKDASLFTLSQQVTEAFLRNGQNEHATTVMNLVADTFEKSKEEQLANAAKMVREQVAILEVNLDDKVRAVMEKKPKADEELLAALDKLFGDRELGPMTLQFLAQILHAIETENVELTSQAYAKTVAAYEKHSPPDLVKQVQESAEKFGKRRALIGQPFVVEGLTLDGKPFDWKQYEGKVVLVDFWATWCGPCLREIPNIKQNYEQYKAQGFEVVGVNIDEDPAALQRFFSVQKLPWPTVVSPDPNKVGFDHPLMSKCGVEGIPFLVLVGRDGKVITLNPRGEELGKKLAAVFSAKAP